MFIGGLLNHGHGIGGMADVFDSSISICHLISMM
jgi:hypothetical protein